MYKIVYYNIPYRYHAVSCVVYYYYHLYSRRIVRVAGILWFMVYRIIVYRFVVYLFLILLVIIITVNDRFSVWRVTVDLLEYPFEQDLRSLVCIETVRITIIHITFTHSFYFRCIFDTSIFILFNIRVNKMWVKYFPVENT